MTTVNINEIYYLETMLVDKEGVGIPDLVVTYSVSKSSDNSIIESGTLPSIGDGVYQKPITLTVLGQYRVFYFAPKDFDETIETIVVIEKSALDVGVADVKSQTQSIEDKIDNIDLQIDTGGYIL